MELSSFNYSIHEHGGRLYFEQNHGATPKEPTLITLQKIEKYISENWQYTTNQRLLAAHPNPWPQENLRGHLARIARIIHGTNTNAPRPMLDTCSRFLTGETFRLNSAIERINNLMLSLKSVSESEIAEAEAILGPSKIDSEYVAFFLAEYSTFLNDLIKQNRVPSNLKAYNRDGSISLRETTYNLRLKTVGSFAEKSNQIWINTSCPELFKEFTNKRQYEKIYFLNMILCKNILIEEAIDFATRAGDLRMVKMISKLFMESLLTRSMKSTIAEAFLRSHDQILVTLLNSSLFYISSAGFTAFIEETILQFNANLNTNINETLLYKAIEIASYLDVKSDLSEILEYALSVKNIKLVKHLLTHGASLKTGQLPLHEAFEKSPDKVKELILAGLDINAVDIHGYPAFFYAREVEMLKFAIEHGADVNGIFNGKTLLTFHMNNPDLFNFLIQYPLVLSRARYKIIFEEAIKNEVSRVANLYGTNVFGMNFLLNFRFHQNSPLSVLFDLGLRLPKDFNSDELRQFFRKYLANSPSSISAETFGVGLILVILLKMGLSLEFTVDEVPLRILFKDNPTLSAIMKQFDKAKLL